jgi:netrin-G3 ligand
MFFVYLNSFSNTFLTFVAADGPANHGFQSGEVIEISDFSEHCRILAADSNYLYSHEYSQIPRKNASLTMHHAQNQVNREKNRYNNILCYDSTRVILKTDPTGNDYVNASRLDGFEKEKAYIASQGPLENTCEDFWRMVWENVTSTVVMVGATISFYDLVCCTALFRKVNLIN